MIARDRQQDYLALNLLGNERYSRRPVPAWLLWADSKGFRPRRRYRTIWISDVHLGTWGCNAAMLVDFPPLPSGRVSFSTS